MPLPRPHAVSPSPASVRKSPRKSLGLAPVRLGVGDSWGEGPARQWKSTEGAAKNGHAVAAHEAAPPVLLTGPVLGGIVGAMLSVTTTLYLNHDREEKEWITVNTTQRTGHWPAPTGDFNWCEPDYVYSPYLMELWNSLTSFGFVVGPLWLWGRTRDLEVRLNLLLVGAIGLGSAAFHGTLQYEAQLLDELPMICYIMHTTALLARKDVSCPVGLKLYMLALCALLGSTSRESLPHKAGRVVMVLGFSGCFVWLAYSLAALSTELDKRAGRGWLFTSLYQRASLTVVLAIVAWITDNLACKALHTLPFGLPYPHLHASVWHTGMAYVCYCLCRAVLGKQEQYAARVATS